MSMGRFADLVEGSVELTGAIAPVSLADLDGAFDEMAANIEHRTAGMIGVFARFVQAEFRKDVEARRVEFADDADQHPLPRTAAQRSFDALQAGVEASGSFDSVVNIVADEATVGEVLSGAGLTLPSGRQLDVDEFGSLSIDAVVDEFVADPASLFDRRCETADGTPIHPTLLLRALVNAQGGTDQFNADVRCGGHNRFKHRQRWRTRRDQHGRSYSIRPDGTIVLPVGEREPDLSIDELTRIARTRAAALRPLQPTG